MVRQEGLVEVAYSEFRILAEVICGWSLGALGPLGPGAALDDVPARLAPPTLLAASALQKYGTIFFRQPLADIQPGAKKFLHVLISHLPPTH